MTAFTAKHAHLVSLLVSGFFVLTDDDGHTVSQAEYTREGDRMCKPKNQVPIKITFKNINNF